MPDIKKYAFVLDAEGKQLDPTIEQNAWRQVRQHKAKLVSRFPMVIQLNKVVDIPNTDEIRCGIDDGANHVGIALVPLAVSEIEPSGHQPPYCGNLP